jgi:hypothetical protein
MPNNVVVSKRLLSKIAKHYINLQKSNKRKEADEFIKRICPTSEFAELLKHQIKEEVLNK